MQIEVKFVVDANDAAGHQTIQSLLAQARGAVPTGVATEADAKPGVTRKKATRKKKTAKAAEPAAAAPAPVAVAQPVAVPGTAAPAAAVPGVVPAATAAAPPQYGIEHVQQAISALSMSCPTNGVAAASQILTEVCGGPVQDISAIDASLWPTIIQRCATAQQNLQAQQQAGS